MQHIPNDIGLEEFFISPDDLKTQGYLDQISKWTADSQMKLNENKTKYMIFSRSPTEVATRLTVNGLNIERIEEKKFRVSG